MKDIGNVVCGAYSQRPTNKMTSDMNFTDIVGAIVTKWDIRVTWEDWGSYAQVDTNKQYPLCNTLEFQSK